MVTNPVVTVYVSGPSCMACVQTKRHMDKRGIKFTEVNIHDDENVAAAIDYLGYTSAPIVLASGIGRAGEQEWSGYRPDRIDGLVA